jgi:hypothetical protein
MENHLKAKTNDQETPQDGQPGLVLRSSEHLADLGQNDHQASVDGKVKKPLKLGVVAEVDDVLRRHGRLLQLQLEVSGHVEGVRLAALLLGHPGQPPQLLVGGVEESDEARVAQQPAADRVVRTQFLQHRGHGHRDHQLRPQHRLIKHTLPLRISPFMSGLSYHCGYF